MEGKDRASLALDNGVDAWIASLAKNASARVAVIVQAPGAVLMPWRDFVDGIALMFLGRLGPITLGTALLLRNRPRKFRLPDEAPLIG